MTRPVGQSNAVPVAEHAAAAESVPEIGRELEVPMAPNRETVEGQGPQRALAARRSAPPVVIEQLVDMLIELKLEAWHGDESQEPPLPALIDATLAGLAQVDPRFTTRAESGHVQIPAQDTFVAQTVELEDVQLYGEGGALAGMGGSPDDGELFDRAREVLAPQLLRVLQPSLRRHAHSHPDTPLAARDDEGLDRIIEAVTHELGNVVDVEFSEDNPGAALRRAYGELGLAAGERVGSGAEFGYFAEGNPEGVPEGYLMRPNPGTELFEQLEDVGQLFRLVSVNGNALDGLGVEGILGQELESFRDERPIEFTLQPLDEALQAAGEPVSVEVASERRMLPSVAQFVRDGERSDVVLSRVTADTPNELAALGEQLEGVSHLVVHLTAPLEDGEEELARLAGALGRPERGLFTVVGTNPEHQRTVTGDESVPVVVPDSVQELVFVVSEHNSPAQVLFARAVGDRVFASGAVPESPDGPGMFSSDALGAERAFSYPRAQVLPADGTDYQEVQVP